MDKKYITLFKNLAQATAVSAETVMEYDQQKNDDKGYETARVMRDDFQDLMGRVDVTEYVMSKADAAKFLVGAMVTANQIQDRITNLKNALAGYQTDIIPKLNEVLGAENDEKAASIAEEKFQIKEETNN